MGIKYMDGLYTHIYIGGGGVDSIQVLFLNLPLTIPLDPLYIPNFGYIYRTKKSNKFSWQNLAGAQFETRRQTTGA